MVKIGADILLEAMVANNIDRIYGYPGGANIPLYDKINQCKQIEHILVRHEQAAAFGAQGQSRTSDKVGVCLVTSGPGASNALTGVYDAYMDNIPMIFITAQVPHSMMGNDVFQEMDTIGSTMSFTKHNFLIDDVNTIPHVLNEAIKLATSGRPGPVHIDLPKDMQVATYNGDENIVGYINNEDISKNYEITDNVLDDIIKALNKSERPILLVGQGVKLSRAEQELNQLIDILGIPTVSTLHAKGIVNEANKNYLGMIGMHGFYHANQSLYHADLILNIGSRFDDRIVGTYESFAAEAKVIHVDIDKSELNKLVSTDIPVLSDAKYFLNKLLEKDINKLNIEKWLKRINIWNETHPFEENTKHFGIKNSLQVINKITEKNLDKYIFATDVGQHQIWSAQVIKVPHSRAWLTSGGAGTMGFGLPTAVGAALTNPEKTIIVIAGDGGIQMNIQELQLLKHHNLNVKVIVVNNSFLGMVRQWQDLFFEKNYSSTPLSSPNFKKLAEAYDIAGYSTSDAKDFEDILGEEINKKGPALIEVVINEHEDNIYPMVAPGTKLNETIVK